MTEQEEEYLLERINSAFTQKWHKVTPELLKTLKKEREEYQKSKLKDEGKKKEEKWN